MDAKRTKPMPADEYRAIRERTASDLLDVRQDLAVLAHSAIVPNTTDEDIPPMLLTVAHLKQLDREKFTPIPKQFLPTPAVKGAL